MVTKKKKVKEEKILEEKEVLKLSEVEMDKIDHFNKDVKIVTKDIECFDLKIELLEKEIQLIRGSKLEQVNAFKAKKREYSEFIKDIREKYGIEGEFSFHPETGEIIK